MNKPLTTASWLALHVAYEGDDCLIWPFSRFPNGYGQRVEKKTHTTAHRSMCKLAHGEPPTPEHQAAHSCGNGHLGCVHPKHLSWKTPAENAEDKLAHGTSNAGERNGQAKLTASQINEIRALLSTGQSCASIARQYGVSAGAIYNINHNRSWRVAA